MKWPPTMCWTAPKTMNGNRHFQVKAYGGKNENIYRPLTDKEHNDEKFIDFKKILFRGKGKPKFLVFFNSRNIRRKAIPDTMLAFRAFLDSLPPEDAKECFLLLHTEGVTDHGTDLYLLKNIFLKFLP